MTSPRILLKAWNIRANKRLGQHFLADPSTAEMILTRSGILPEDVVLEIGAGLGALTIPLARRAKQVYAIEKDQQIIPLLKAELVASKVSNVVLLEENVLNIDIAEIAATTGGKIIVMGNLPYNISSQIVVRLIQARTMVSRAFLMFQRELARRLAAPPGGKDYGRLTVMLQYCAEVRTLGGVAAPLFFPKPKVDSEVLEVAFKAVPEFPADDENLLFRVIKAAFGKRRKTLKNALSASDLQLDPMTTRGVLKKAGIDPARRAETLSVEEFVRLTNTLHSFPITP